MRFLAGESCDFAVVRALRKASHDVAAVAEMFPAAEDAVVIDLALKDKRVLPTEDKDFGQLVFAHKLPCVGVILLRYPMKMRKTLPGMLIDLVTRREEVLREQFVVRRPGRLRTVTRPGA